MARMMACVGGERRDRRHQGSRRRVVAGVDEQTAEQVTQAAVAQRRQLVEKGCGSGVGSTVDSWERDDTSLTMV